MCFPFDNSVAKQRSRESREVTGRGRRERLRQFELRDTIPTIPSVFIVKSLESVRTTEPKIREDVYQKEHLLVILLLFNFSVVKITSPYHK